MSEHETPGGAASALASHSKDASTPGQTPAAETLGHQAEARHPPGVHGGISEKVHEGVERAKTTVLGAASSARDIVSGQGSDRLDQAADFIRARPLASVVLTGAACFALGMLISRR